jgi:2-polyprenyl-3-methyl-5-hydroxy-6-metoxy-1,4-benzoquinol methylase
MLSPIGSILRHFSEVKLSTAEEKSYSIKMSPINKLAVLIFGTPHIWFRMRARILLKMFRGVPKDRKILEGGCGYGIVSMTLAERGFKNLTLLDLDKERIATIDKGKTEYGVLKDIKTKVGSLTELPYENSSFEVVMSSEVIEHITDDKKAFNELSRVLKPEGTLIVTTPEYSESNKLDYKQYGHKKPGYTVEEFEGMAKENGLAITKVIHYIYTPAKWAVNLLNRFTSKPIIALFFYPLYLIAIIDRHFKIGESNSIIVMFKKTI